MPDQPLAAERVLVLAPLGRDGVIAAAELERAGLSAVVCRDAAALADELDSPAGAAIVAQEALSKAALAELAVRIERQPPWSDFPFIVFGAGAGSRSAVETEAIAVLGNVTFLDRPVRVVTLLTAVHAALRARRRQYQVRELLEARELAVTQRDRFLAMLGHELRNPLAALLSAAALSAGEGASDQADESGRALPRAIMRRQGEILTRLVDDLLDVSRLSTGKIHLQRTLMSLDELARRSVDAMRLRTGRGEISLRSEGPSWVDGDPVRIEQVLLNLLTNAVKFTPPPGEIAVECRREGAWAVVSVADRGTGIDHGLLPHVFDMFRQADETLDRAQGGLGIGLTLVRAIVEMHGGQVMAASPGPGEGSTFTVRLPRAEAPAADTAPAALSVAAPRAVGARSVFVVEDQADNREAMVAFVSSLGHQVAAAADGMTGVDRIIATRPDVALVDIGLPGIDGYEVARRVRAALGSPVYLVALTGYGRVEDRFRAAEAGFDLHLTKPVDLDDLKSLLATAGSSR
jgi:signal transduction histidine kinase